MTDTIQRLDRKLEAGQNLKSVVSTMKGMASVSIHEYEEAVRAVRSFTRTIDLGYQVLFEIDRDLVPDRTIPSGRTAAIVVGSDQGLCGPLNRDVVRHALDWLGPAADDAMIAVLGVRAERDLELHGHPADEGIALPGSVEAIPLAVRDLVLRIDRWRAEEEVDRVVVFHQVPIRRARHEPAATVVVPADVERLRELADRPWPTNQIPSAPGDTQELLTALGRERVSTALFRAIAEARAAEHGARLSAMQSAEENIEERIEHLRNRYHQARQSQITAELLDVVSGYEALSKPR